VNSLTYFFKRSPKLLALAIVTGLLSGISNTGLVIVINQSLYRRGPAAASLIWGFVAIGLIFLATRFISTLVLTNLSRRTMVDLQMRLSLRILATPLRRLEEVGLLA